MRRNRRSHAVTGNRNELSGASLADKSDSE